MSQFLRSLKINNLLSFGPDSPAMEFGPLNVIIGPNGSGKSNLFDVLALLKNAPGEFDKPIRESGCPLSEWLWKRETDKKDHSKIEVMVSNYRHFILFCEKEKLLNIVDEHIENCEQPGKLEYYGKDTYRDKYYASSYVTQLPPSLPVLPDRLPRWFNSDEERNNYPNLSALSRFSGKGTFPELAKLSENYQSIYIYNNWTFGRKSPLRFPQLAYQPNKWLNEDGSNFYVVLKKIKEDKESHSRYLEFLKQLYEDVDDYEIVQLDHLISIKLVEGENRILASRLSDGTLRYMMLLAVLCDPEPPPLICIEEPEMGLHPDLIMVMGNALKYASERTQVIATTHSVRLVDCFNDSPEVIQVCEKHDGSTIIERLDPEYLKPWLEKYRLGELWTRGGIGGNRW